MKKIFLAIASLLAINSAFSQENKTSAATEQSFIVGKYTIKYIVENRKAIRLPKIDIMSDDHGTVVVDVVVDKYGNVISAAPNPNLSECKSTYLITKSKQAAETTHFDTTPTTPLKTKGTMTFAF